MYYLYVSIYGRMGGWMDKWLDGCMGGWMDKLTADGYTNGWMD